MSSVAKSDLPLTRPIMGFNSFYRRVGITPSIASDRYLELCQKQRLNGLTPDEDAERLGYVIFPDHERGRELHSKDHAAKTNNSSMAKEEVAELAAIRISVFTFPRRRELQDLFTQELLSNQGFASPLSDNDKEKLRLVKVAQWNGKLTQTGQWGENRIYFEPIPYPNLDQRLNSSLTMREPQEQTPKHLCWMDQQFDMFYTEAITGKPYTECHYEDLLNGNFTLTEFGKVFADRVQGRTFIDICCGNKRYSKHSRVYPLVFKAESYLGIDSDHVQNEIISGEEYGAPQFKIKHVRSELLSALKELEPVSNGTFIFISGVEISDEKNPESTKYIFDVETEIIRLIQNGGAVSTGQGTKGFNFPARGLQEISRNKVFAIYTL